MMHCSCIESEIGDHHREAETRRLRTEKSRHDFAAKLRIAVFSPTKNNPGPQMVDPTILLALIFLSVLLTETRY
jgi:hypothetical protein